MTGGVITAAVTGVAGQMVSALDGLFTSDDERNQAELRMQELLMQPQLQQALANVAAAQHSSLFVAGARPALLWICAAGFAWEFILRPLLGAALVIAGLWGGNAETLTQTAAALPSLDLDQLMSLALAMLGLTAARSYEKRHGVARETLVSEGLK